MLSIRTAAICISGAMALLAGQASAQNPEDLPRKDRTERFAQATDAGMTGIARKTKPVDARPAVEGEVIVTVIAAEGIETKSKPAEKGAWVVRNRCPQTGNEEYLVSAEKFPARYGEAQGPADDKGFMEFIPSGKEMRYFIIPESDGAFAIEAPWGELQAFRPGDAMVQAMDDPNDTYRVQKEAFACTYEILEPAKP